MKHMMIALCGLMIAGCASTGEIEEANAKIADLEKIVAEIVGEKGAIVDHENRLAHIEKDLYQIEMKKAPAVSLPKLAPIKELEPTIQEVSINAFIKEYLGAEFGDSIDKYPESENPRSSQRRRVIPMTKKIGYLDKAFGEFEYGKLYSVTFYMVVDKKFSYDSTEFQFLQSVADIMASLGIDHRKIGDCGYQVGNVSVSTYKCRDLPMWRMSLTFKNKTMFKKICSEGQARAHANGETLPDPK